MPPDHDIVEIMVLIRCRCGATGTGTTESAALDELEANCDDMDQVVEQWGDAPTPREHPFNMHRYFRDRQQGRYNR